MTARKSVKQQGVESVEVGMRLLQCLAKNSGPMKLRDLASAAGIAPAKAHRYLVSLSRTLLVEQQYESGRYDLGPQALDLGLCALARLQPMRVAAPMLNDLKDEIGQTVALAVWANRGATVVSWVGSDAPVSATLRVGSVMPLTRSATGRVFIAYLSGKMTAELVKAELAENQRLNLKPQSLTAVRQVVEQTKQVGFSIVEDFIPGISGVAAPVFDNSGCMILSLVALGHTEAFNLMVPGTVVAAVCKAAQQLSKRLGYGGGAAS